MDPLLADELRRLARERSHQDSKASNDFFRSSAQAAILINGGAATAILAFAQRTSSPTLPMRALAVALLFYACGAVFGALAIYATAQTAGKWSNFWEAHALDQEIKPELHKSGELWSRRTIRTFALSVGCFAFASIEIAIAFFFAS